MQETVVLIQIRLHNHNKNISIPYNRNQMQLNLFFHSTSTAVLEMGVFITKFILFQNELLLIKLVAIKKVLHQEM